MLRLCACYAQPALVEINGSCPSRGHSAIIIAEWLLEPHHHSNGATSSVLRMFQMAHQQQRRRRRRVHDPAQQDTSLSRRLRENRNVALSHLDEIIRKYAELQDDGEDDYRKKTRKGSERNRQSSSERSEEDEESEESDTDIEEELKQSDKMPDSEEGENEEEETSVDQENEADQKMDMASDEDRDKEKEDCDDETDNVMEEATEQESSPASTSSSQDKGSPNTTLESEVEAQLSSSSGLPSSPAKAKSDDEDNEEQEACDTTRDLVEESEEPSGLVPSSVDKGPTQIKDDSDVSLDSKTNEKHKSAQNYLLPNIRVSLENKDEDNSEQDGEDVAVPTDHPPCAGSDAEIDSELARSPVVEEESWVNVNTEETHVKRMRSPDSEAASMEEEPLCTETAGDHDNEDAAASDGQRSADSPAATKVHTEAAELDPCGNIRDCDSSPLGSSNGVHATTPVRSTSVNRLKLNKDKATHRNSHKPRKTEEDSPTPYRKRKYMSSGSWAERNGLKRHNGKKYPEDHIESNRKRVKMDCSFTALASSSDCDSDDDDDTPGLMMTCSPRETPIKRTRKAHVFTQCDPDEVIVLSD
ncbi:hypothetical protein GDO78_022710 [Eleutherodactylus coqui]|uniref:Daxx histone-binding domain-containing protein n=1 Tax=Eleutherodactylus coqui TaxID=57060 RepID=A0A8J6EGC6_ELECQ|nr:hypothetical protein GDO78_022710 [Eleutherodactylus coqui]